MLVSSNETDVFWEQDTLVIRSFVPDHGALYYVAGAINFDTVSYHDISTATLTSETINGSDNSNNQIPTNTVVFGRTSAGRYTKFKIIDYGYNLALQWQTYQ